MVSSNRLSLLTLVCFCLLATFAYADSQTRMVRLSDVDGSVKIDRNAGLGMEKAFVNLPITQGAKVSTLADGRAEIEFEDGSTLRLAPATQVSFSQLSLQDSGGKVSTVHLGRGTAYVNFAGHKGDAFTLAFGENTMTLKDSAHLRVVVDDTDAKVAVFKGDAEITSPSGNVEISKNHTADVELLYQDKCIVDKGVEPAPFDDWDKEQAQYHERYQNTSTMASSQYGYGASDLNYYGSYFDAPGYGTLWQPYLVGAGWDPFMNGAWAFYPGSGYAWVSGYPWGWTPFHSGSWLYLPTYGWAWQPGNNFSGWSLTSVRNAPAGFHLPQAPSGSTNRSTILVTRGPAPSQFEQSSRKVTIPQNSAGLGIPRGGIKNFGELSQTVQKSGFANARLHIQPVGRAADTGTRGFSSIPVATRGGASVPRSSGPSIGISHSSAGHVSK